MSGGAQCPKVLNVRRCSMSEGAQCPKVLNVWGAQCPKVLNDWVLIVRGAHCPGCSMTGCRMSRCSMSGCSLTLSLAPEQKKGQTEQDQYAVLDEQYKIGILETIFSDKTFAGL